MGYDKVHRLRNPRQRHFLLNKGKYRLEGRKFRYGWEITRRNKPTKCPKCGDEIVLGQEQCCCGHLDEASIKAGLMQRVVSGSLKDTGRTVKPICYNRVVHILVDGSGQEWVSINIDGEPYLWRFPEEVEY